MTNSHGKTCSKSKWEAREVLPFHWNTIQSLRMFHDFPLSLTVNHPEMIKYHSPIFITVYSPSTPDQHYHFITSRLTFKHIQTLRCVFSHPGWTRFARRSRSSEQKRVATAATIPSAWQGNWHCLRIRWPPPGATVELLWTVDICCCGLRWDPLSTKRWKVKRAWSTISLAPLTPTSSSWMYGTM